MSGSELKLQISADAMEKIIQAHDGDMALLWLYLQKNPSGSLENAARTLCRTMSEIAAAEEKLERLDLSCSAGSEEKKSAGKISGYEKKLPPEDELPDYRISDLVSRSQEDSKFAALVTEAQRALGRILSTSDMKKLFGLYDYLALPPEVIMMLLNYCVSSAGTGNSISMRQVEKEGYVWSNKAISTLEQAEEYIATRQKRSEELIRAAQVLGIRGRPLSQTESKFLSSWLDMGFDDVMLEMAYDRTLTNTGGLKWGYMNGILKNWHEKNLYTPEDVKLKDTKTGQKKVRTGENPQNLEKLLKDLDEL